MSVDDAELITLRLHAGGERRTWDDVHQGGIAADQRSLAEVERHATEVRVFQSSVIPGQLQIAPYAKRLLELGTPKSPAEIAAGVQARLDRQGLLYDPPASGCHFLISEAALRWRPEGDDGRLLAAQLDRLLALFGLPGVEIGLLSWRDAQPATHRHPFVLYRMSDDDDDLVIVETVDGETIVRDEHLISRYVERYDRLRSVARVGDDARQLVATILRDLNEASSG